MLKILKKQKVLLGQWGWRGTVLVDDKTYYKARTLRLWCWLGDSKWANGQNQEPRIKITRIWKHDVWLCYLVGRQFNNWCGNNDDQYGEGQIGSSHHSQKKSISNGWKYLNARGKNFKTLRRKYRRLSLRPWDRDWLLKQTIGSTIHNWKKIL